MRCFKRVVIVCVFILLTETVSIAKDEIKILLTDWQQSAEFLRNIDFSSEGTLVDNIDPTFFNMYIKGVSNQNQTTKYNWKVIRLKNKFSIETSDNNFEWNPKISPNGNHLLFSFNDQYYTFLRSNKNSQSEYNLSKDNLFKLRPPTGSIESKSYIQSHATSLISPLDNNDIASRKLPIVYNVTSSRISRIIKGIQSSLPYPFTPYDLTLNPFFTPDTSNTSGNIAEYLLKHTGELIKTEQGSFTSLKIPISVSTKILWVPEQIFFKKINNKNIPFRFLGGNEYIPGSKRSIFRDVEIKNWIIKDNIIIPSEIKALEYHKNEKGEFMLAKTQYKSLDRLEFGESLKINQITINIPIYAEIHKDGVWIKNKNIPDPPRPAWFYIVTIFFAIIIFTAIKTVIKQKYFK